MTLYLKICKFSRPVPHLPKRLYTLRCPSLLVPSHSLTRSLAHPQSYATCPNKRPAHPNPSQPATAYSNPAPSYKPLNPNHTQAQPQPQDMNSPAAEQHTISTTEIKERPNPQKLTHFHPHPIDFHLHPAQHYLPIKHLVAAACYVPQAAPPKHHSNPAKAYSRTAQYYAALKQSYQPQNFRMLAAEQYKASALKMKHLNQFRQPADCSSLLIQHYNPANSYPSPARLASKAAHYHQPLKRIQKQLQKINHFKC